MKYLKKIFFLCIFFYFTGFSQTNYLLKDGGFEDNINYWVLRGECEISNENAHTGKKALKISHFSNQDNFAYVYLKKPTTQFEFNIWFQPQDSIFQTKIDFVANWDKSGADYIVSLVLKNNSLSTESLNLNKITDVKIDYYQWNKISIKSDSLGYYKNIFVNDSLCASIKALYNVPVEAIILGGLNCDNCFGSIFFDDVSIINTNVKTDFGMNNIYWIQGGLVSSFAGLGLNLQIGHISGPHLFKVRYLTALESRLVIFAVERPKFDSPRESIQEIAFIYGRYYKNNFSVISIAAGIGYVDAVKKGPKLKEYVYKRDEVVKISLPIELTFKKIVTKNFAVSIGAYAILNDDQSFIGATMGVELGKFY